jgi:hypothetical protein
MPVLALSMLLLAVSSVAGRAQAYDPRYPVCMKLYEGSEDGGEWIDCSYASMQQCRASAAGRPAMCDQNPYYGQQLRRSLGTTPRHRQTY